MSKEEVENLMEYAFSDGNITSKEIDILHNKAEEAGLTLTEFNCMLANESSKRWNAENAPRACPACGALVEFFSVKCLYCGYEYSNVKANSSITRLFNQLKDIDARLSRYDIRGNKSEAEVYASMSGAIFEKRGIIIEFPIPDTKDDILEFLIMAIPNATEQVAKPGEILDEHTLEQYAQHNDFTDAWKVKCEEMIESARISMKDDNNTLDEILLYAKKINAD